MPHSAKRLASIPVPRQRVGRIVLAALSAFALTVHCAADNKPATVGIDVAGMDKTVRAGDDFNGYTNGHWADVTEIPADRSSWGLDPQLVELNTQRIAEIIKGIGGPDIPANVETKKVADYYHAYLDEVGIDVHGLNPLKQQLHAIESINSKQALSAALGRSIRADVDPMNATNFETENVFGVWVAQGLEDPSHYVPYLLQGGLGLPDRDYYVNDSPKMVEIRAKYVAHIAAVFKLAGLSDPNGRARKVYDLEHHLAVAHASREDSENVAKANNVWKREDFASKAPGMDWPAFFNGAGLAGQTTFVAWHPGAIIGESAQVKQTSLDAWKDYLRFHLLNHYADVLPKAFADEHFAFYGKLLSGTPQMQERWKRAVDATSVALADPVGKLYTDRFFNAEAKAKANEMVTNIVAAFSRRIDQLDWMAPATKAQAQAKLKTLYVGVGYPETWRDFSGLVVDPHDAVGNALRVDLFNYQYAIGKLGKPVDRKEWCMSPQTVNAVNMPLQNALNFPAAILQPPYFDPAASDAMNYGAIGAVIGHEISHSFDDQGAQFDSEGRLRNWWTNEDLAHFKASSAALAEQYSIYRPFADLPVNGQQTLSENIADLAGLTVAFDAFHEAQKGKREQTDQGFSPDQQFFIAFGQSWRTKVRDEALRKQVKTDGHAPAKYRVDTVRNIDAWYKLFDVLPGEALYLDPAHRVHVW